MSKRVLFPVLILAGCLAGCGYFDAQQSFVPEILRAKKPEPELPDPKPDAAAFVDAHRAEIFTGEVSDVRVGNPQPMGLHWEVCTAASVKGVTGVWSDVTLLIEIRNGHLESRRRALDGDHCPI